MKTEVVKEASQTLIFLISNSWSCFFLCCVQLKSNSTAVNKTKQKQTDHHNH